MNKFFALVRRALQTETRLARSHLARSFLAGFVLWTLITTQYQAFFSFGAPGLNLFRSIAIYNYFFVTVLGTAFFATSITEEKEERTLGMLKMAGVGPTAMIMGKWTPRMIGVFFLLSIQIPFTVLATTLGGILWHQIAAAYFALFAHLFFVGNIGLLCSIVMSTTTSACGVAAAVLIGYHFLPMILTGLLNNYRGFMLADLFLFFADKLRAMSGFNSLGMTMTTGFSSGFFSYQVVSNLIAGLILLLIAWCVFDACTRNEKEGGELNSFDRIRRRLAQQGKRRVWQPAIVWKDFHLVGGGAWFLGLKFVIYFTFMFIFAVAISSGNAWTNFYDVLGGALVWWSIFFFVIELAIMTSRLYRTELSNQTWATLMMLPRAPQQIIYSKLLGGASALAPAFWCFMIGVICVPDDVFDFLEEMLRRAENFFGFTYFVMQIVMSIHLSTFLSVSQKWAIWPISVFLSGFIVFIINMTFISCLFGVSNAMDEGAFFFMGSVAAAIVSVTLHVWTHHQLIEKAGS